MAWVLADRWQEIEVSASCERTARLEMRINGAMQSELSEQVVTVEGHVAVERR